MTSLRCGVLLLALLTVLVEPCPAAGGGPLSSLLEELHTETRELSTRRARREQDARSRRDAARTRVAELRAALDAEEARCRELEERHESSRADLERSQQLLTERAGDLEALAETFRQLAGELEVELAASLVERERPGRAAALADLAARRGIPTVEDLELLWHHLLEELVLGGEVSTFEAEVVERDGEIRRAPVTRIGVFTASSRGRFLAHLPTEGRLLVLARQPPAAAQRRARALETASEGVMPATVDPSRGALLGVLVQTPDLFERVHQGGVIGYVILALGALGALLALERLVVLGQLARRVERQRATPCEPTPDNPLGRVLTAAGATRGTPPEVLERRLEEAVLREVPALTRGARMLQLVAAMTPLLGLLGTVAGMITTFQRITLLGAGDPRLMADGISQALVTTALGLSVAIPCVFLHRLVVSRAEAVLQVLEEQSAGILARRDDEASEGER